MSTTITKLFNDMSIDNNHESEHPINNKRKRAPFECTICMISYRSNISHSTNKCSHSICRECARKYFNSALEDVRYTSYETIECPSPDCKEHFVTQDVLQNLFSKAEMKRWWTFAIIKAHVKNKVRCPFANCRAIYDTHIKCTKQCTFGECYECRRGFCIACQSHWHPGEIKIVDDEETVKKVLEHGQHKEWARCPRCEHLVEKVSGCITMRCVCGAYFCYRCGGLSQDHSCINRCQNFTPQELSKARNSMFDHTTKRIKTKNLA